MHPLGMNFQALGTVFGKWDQFWLPKSVHLDRFWEPGPILAAKIGPGDQFLPKSVPPDRFWGGPIFSVTVTMAAETKGKVVIL